MERCDYILSLLSFSSLLSYWNFVQGQIMVGPQVQEFFPSNGEKNEKNC